MSRYVVIDGHTAERLRAAVVSPDVDRETAQQLRGFLLSPSPSEDQIRERLRDTTERVWAGDDFSLQAPAA
jgi:hypothetical protein